MQKYALLATMMFPWFLPGFLLGCTDEGELMEGASTDEEAENGDAGGENLSEDESASSGENEDAGEFGDEIPECWDAPQKCLDFVECAGVIIPDQVAAIQAQFGVDGSCWCGTTEEQAVACYDTCVKELAAAVEANPTEPMCHRRFCPIEELDPDQPYGPLIDGGCPEVGGITQIPLVNPLGVEGSVCAPKCSGIAKYCVAHPQTTAEGTCFLRVGEDDYCVSRCWVDPFHFGKTGTQCQCGARCRPHGPPDGEGNMRGICTFE